MNRTGMIARRGTNPSTRDRGGCATLRLCALLACLAVAATGQSLNGSFVSASGTVQSGSLVHRLVVGQTLVGRTHDSAFELHFGVLSQSQTITDVGPQSPEPPSQFALQQNYPNPFNPQTVIAYDVPEAGRGSVVVSLKVYDLLGREVTVLVREAKPPGRYEARFDASTLPSGTYLYQLSAGGFVATRKLLLLK